MRSSKIKNLDLEIIQKLPSGVVPIIQLPNEAKVAGGFVGFDNEYKTFHHCPDCKGWIAGKPIAHKHNNLRPTRLTGRRGTSWYCARCGWQLAYRGKMS